MSCFIATHPFLIVYIDKLSEPVQPLTEDGNMPVNGKHL